MPAARYVRALLTLVTVNVTLALLRFIEPV